MNQSFGIHFLRDYLFSQTLFIAFKRKNHLLFLNRIRKKYFALGREKNRKNFSYEFTVLLDMTVQNMLQHICRVYVVCTVHTWAIYRADTHTSTIANPHTCFCLVALVVFYILFWLNGFCILAIVCKIRKQVDMKQTRAHKKVYKINTTKKTPSTTNR